MICYDEYRLKSDKTECSKLVIPECIEYLFENDYIECTKCNPGFRVARQNIKPDPNSDSTILTNICVEDTSVVSIKGCKVY